MINRQKLKIAISFEVMNIQTALDGIHGYALRRIMALGANQLICFCLFMGFLHFVRNDVLTKY
jgi:hypothetical protein